MPDKRGRKTVKVKVNRKASEKPSAESISCGFKVTFSKEKIQFQDETGQEGIRPPQGIYAAGDYLGEETMTADDEGGRTCPWNEADPDE